MVNLKPTSSLKRCQVSLNWGAGYDQNAVIVHNLGTVDIANVQVLSTHSSDIKAPNTTFIYPDYYHSGYPWWSDVSYMWTIIDQNSLLLNYYNPINGATAVRQVVVWGIKAL